MAVAAKVLHAVVYHSLARELRAFFGEALVLNSVEVLVPLVDAASLDTNFAGLA